MSDPSVPAVPEAHPVSEELRGSVMEHLRGLVTGDRISLERFSDLTTSVMQARTYDALSDALRDVPAAVAFTPPARRMNEPLLLRAHTGGVTMEGRWQLAKETVARVNIGGIHLDLTSAEFDAPVVDLDLEANLGGIKVIVPVGVTVQIIEVGPLRNDLGDDVPIPGAPLVRLRAKVQHGVVRLERPPLPKQKFWRRLFARP